MDFDIKDAEKLYDITWELFQHMQSNEIQDEGLMKELSRLNKITGWILTVYNTPGLGAEDGE